ncbi:hypothetical protein H8L32_16990 [Undibacterium sp. CY18W]|uniref:Uncharacterized protein n=1 Tax=Undibacterium hunanense TaxID=2762292 RepID=A0ABR6ZTJ0_9BURK|nr:hypothetical protein [Undibacterium hunanense]MBC3919191.1 hypothetical protein [Undibacterium hunanense]
MRRHEYCRDPLAILLQREEKTCKGCRHQGWVEIGEKRQNICKLKDNHRPVRLLTKVSEQAKTATGAKETTEVDGLTAALQLHGQRCKSYEERE